MDHILNFFFFLHRIQRVVWFMIFQPYGYVKMAPAVVEMIY